MTSLAVDQRTSPRDKKRIPRLDGIRGLCAIAVIFAHAAFSTIVLSPDAGPPPEGIWSILVAGQLSIGPFFVLSGLLLYRPFARMTLTGAPRPDLGAFFMRRAARMLPAFWLVVTACLLLLNLSTLTGWWDVLRPYLMMHVYDYRWYAGLDVVWTVPTETQFYLALPLLAWVMHRLARNVEGPAKKARRMLIPLGVMMAAQFIWTWWLHGTYETWPTIYFYPFGIVGLLAAGMALAVVSVLSEAAPEKTPRFYQLASRRPNLFWLGAFVAYLINCAQPFDVPGTASFQSAPAALVRSALLLITGVLLVLPLYPRDTNSRLMELTLSNPVMRYLGRISYGLYLWHFAIMYLYFGTGSIFGGAPVPVQALLGKYGFWELFVVTVLGTIVVATVSYYLVERPVINWTEKRVKARAARRAGTPTAATLPASSAEQSNRIPASK